MTVGAERRFPAREGRGDVRDPGGPGGLRPARPVRVDRVGPLTGRDPERLAAHGVRTVVDLREEQEREGAAKERARRPKEGATVRFPRAGPLHHDAGHPRPALRHAEPPPVSGLSALLRSAGPAEAGPAPPRARLGG
ncbi:tyrosine-protein phosphatase [Streptomyces sp. NPDC097619]|uniref:tyrosine-protein phosphatase n=1 Tax=Streptomyces sp. NPDC097619 TaxID=3157228 RepID=UPI003332950F